MMDDLATDAGRSQSFKETAIAVKGRLKTHRGTVFAAAVAFFAFLALIPALTGIIGLYGLVSDPTDVTRQVTDALSTAPETTRDFIVDQMTRIASGNSGALAVSVVVSALIALFSASGAVANLIKALNVAYELEETRKPWTLRGLAFGLMLGGVITLGVVMFLLAAVPSVLGEIGLGTVARWLLDIARFPVLAALLAGALSLLYRVGPDHLGNDRPLLPRLLTVGGLAATVLFVLVSVLFSFYTANFDSYGETYGPLATIIVLLLWFQLSALSVIVGAETDAALAEAAWRRRTGLEDPAARSGDAVTAARGLFAALADHDVDGVLSHWHRSGVQRDPLFGHLAVPEQLRAHLEEMLAAFPGLIVHVDGISGDEDKATVRYRLEGEFAGKPWGRMPPNGRRMELDAVALLTVEDGFVVRNELVYDSAAVASQLGFRPGGNAAGDRWRAGMATMLNRWRSRAL